MRIAHILPAFSLLAVFPFTVFGAIQLGTGLTDSMVIQREQDIVFNGTVSPNANVAVELADQNAAGHADERGHFAIAVHAPPLGGPYTATIASGSDRIDLRNLLCGDVWLCSGQSNMQFGAAEDVEAKRVLADADASPTIHLLTIPKFGADAPKSTVDGNWKVASAETGSKFPDVGLQFAEFLHHDPALKDVPIGLVDSSFGGTAIEEWIPAAAMADMPQDQLLNGMFGLKPSMLFNSMISPLHAMKFKGVLWYQGEANAGHSQDYAKLLTIMIDRWRMLFGEPQMPFFIVQLPAFANGWDGYSFSWLREAQQQVANTVPNTGIAITYDTCDGSDLHPRTKTEIARRLSRLAQAKMYGESIAAVGPIFKSATVAGDAMRVAFDVPGSSLATPADGVVHGFALAGEDGQYFFADGTIDGNSVIVRSKLVPRPATVRYAFVGAPNADLRNADGLAAAPFRTDTAPTTRSPESQHVPDQQHISTTAYEITIDGNGMPISLGSGGQQFLSNNLGFSGGCKIPAGLGPASCNQLTPLAPNVLQYDGSGITMTYTCDIGQMKWTIENHNHEKIRFNINIADQAKAMQDGNAVQLTRDHAGVTIKGLDQPCTVDVPGGESRELHLTFKK